jgi:hypothetical protein
MLEVSCFEPLNTIAPSLHSPLSTVNQTSHHLDIEGPEISFWLHNYACAWFVCTTIYKTDAELSDNIKHHRHTIQCSSKTGLLTGINSALSHISHRELSRSSSLLVHTLSYIIIHTPLRLANPAALDLELQLISITHWAFIVSCSHEELQYSSSTLL